jgi:hypothetical protein
MATCKTKNTITKYFREITCGNTNAVHFRIKSHTEHLLHSSEQITDISISAQIIQPSTILQLNLLTNSDKAENFKRKSATTKFFNKRSII